MTENPTSNYVRLDVGGHLFATHKTTLTKYGDSLLADLVAPENDKRKSDKEYIKIDRDGKCFASILNYLRNGSDTLDLNSIDGKFLTALHDEAKYYNMLELTELLGEELQRRVPDRPVPISFRIYLRRSDLIYYLKERLETALIASLHNLHFANWLDSAMFKQLTSLCHPIPVYFHNENYNNEVLSFFHQDEIKSTVFLKESEVNRFKESELNEVLVKVAKDHAIGTLKGFRDEPEQSS